jgi:ribosomal-protein-alanine N-acetyltransferase
METLLSAITTRRLELVPARADLTDRVVDFYERNSSHLAPWEPPKPEGFRTEAFQRERLAQAEGEAAAGTAMRWWLHLRDEPQFLVGSIGLTAIARGPFQNAMLGYALDGPLQRQGLMREALRAVIKYAFSSAICLHRIQANVRPENLRSLRLLEQLGFEHEGLARDYLFIDGAWRDHLMFALRNVGLSGIPK